MATAAGRSEVDGPGELAGVRLPSLTGLRVLAALGVFLYHIAHQNIFAAESANAVFGALFDRAGGPGVSFFFLLSGFVLTWSARPGAPVLATWRRRIVKIFPNHVVTWALTIVVVLALGRAVPLVQAIPNLFLLQSWVPDPAVFFSVNRLSWSLSCELLFYLAFPFLLRGLLRVPTARLWGVAIGLMVAVLCMPFAAGLLGGPTMPVEPGESVPVLSLWLVYIAPPVRLLEFALGMVMARIVLSGRWIGLGWRPAAGLVVLGLALAQALPWLHAQVAATVVPLALVLPAVALLDVRGARSVVGGRAMVYCGDISFAFYLLGGQITFYLLMAFGKGHDVLSGLGVVLVCVATTAALAAVLHRYVEMPAMRRWSRSRRS